MKFLQTEFGIPEELIKKIKINETQNIASNIEIEKDNNFLIGKLKSFTNYNCEETEEITLKIPEKYTEIDKNNNLYEERNYVLNFNEEKQSYDYEVTYKISSLDIENQLSVISNKDNKSYKNNKDITLDDKTFKIYERKYTDKDSNGNEYNINENVLFYELKNDRYLVIIIKANDNDINKELLNSLIKFDINLV